MPRKTTISMPKVISYAALAMAVLAAYKYLHGLEGTVFPAMAWLALAIILFILLFGSMFFTMRPSITVSSDGLYVRGIGLVRWDKIEEIDLVSRNGFSLLGVKTNSSEEIEGMKAWWYRLLSKSVGWPKRDFYLPIRYTNIGGSRVVESILEYSLISGIPNKELQPSADAPVE